MSTKDIKAEPLMVDGTKPHKCSHCDKSFLSVWGKQTHERTHVEPKFGCQFCPKTFHYQLRLDAHIRIHTGEKPFQCKHCAATFKSASHASVHEIRSHRNQSRKFECRFCDKVYTQSHNRKVHEQFEHQGIRFLCGYCAKPFQTRHLQTRHELTHTDEKNYVCGFCSKAFGRQDKLKEHTRVHTGEKPYKCDECGYGILDSHDLVAHKVRRGIHKSTRKPTISDVRYKCKYCTREFKSVGGRNYHEETHSRNQSLI